MEENLITTREFLLSILFVILLTVKMAFSHSITIMCYTIAVCCFVLGGYWSFLGHLYKKKSFQVDGSPRQKGEKEKNELSVGWWARWMAIFAALCFGRFRFTYPLTSIDTTTSAFGLAAICGMYGVVMGLIISLLAWGSGEIMCGGFNHLTQS